MRKIKLLLVMLLGITLVACGSKEDKIELKKEVFTFELGSDVTFDKKDILKTEDKEILDEAKLSVVIDKEIAVENEIVVEEDGKGSVLSISNLPVGEYEGVVEYEKEKAEFKVLVEDTTAPVIKSTKIEVEINTKEDLSAKVEVEDLSEYILAIVMDDVDLSKVGEYKTKVSATDIHKNKTETEITIIVKEKVEDTTEAKKDTETNNNANSETAGSGGSSSTGGNVGGNSGGGTPAPTPSNPTPSTPTPAPRPQVAAGTCEPNNGRFGAVGNSGLVCNSKDAARAWQDSDESWMIPGVIGVQYIEWTVYDGQGERNDIWSFEIVHLR